MFMNFKTKLLVITLLPTMLIAVTSMYIIDQTSIRLIESQAKVIEEIYFEQKEKELRNYVTIAEKALTPTYKSYLKTERLAKAEAQRIVRKMTFGEDNYFYIYDGEGKNIVNPRHTHLIGSNWIGIRYQNGKTVIKDLIEQAKTDGNSYSYNWKKPSSGEYVEKLGYSIYLPKWDWILGTGIYLDDVSDQIQKVQAETESRIDETRFIILLLAIGSLVLTAIILTLARVSEQRFADVRLKQLTLRIVNVQEEERKRVAHELHDGISQLLVSARYGLEAAASKRSVKDVREYIDKSMKTIDNTINEVRRISKALRPSVLDDMGLVSAVKSLGAEFSEQTGIIVDVNARQPKKQITDEARIAVYRVIQEALTNISRHSGADKVTISLKKEKKRFVLQLQDNGVGILSHPEWPPKNAGLGIRNMQERIDAIGGTIQFEHARPTGLIIKIGIPIDVQIADDV
jgi:two-component system NarL family sensor kinase